MNTYKVLCEHCGQKYTKKIGDYVNQLECKRCKKLMNTNFDFNKLTLRLW